MARYVVQTWTEYHGEWIIESEAFYATFKEAAASCKQDCIGMSAQQLIVRL